MPKASKGPRAVGASTGAACPAAAAWLPPRQALGAATAGALEGGRGGGGAR